MFIKYFILENEIGYMKSQKTSNNIQVISRAFEILRIIKKEKGVELSLGKISKLSNLPRSTVQRIINSLIHENYVVFNKSTGLSLGSEIYELASEDNFDVVKALRPIINTLSNRTNETVDLAILKNNKMVLLDRILGTYRLIINSKIGFKFPLISTASGKAALSLLDSSKVEKLIANEISDIKTAINEKKLLNEIAKIGITGIAFDINELNDGISAIGSAFFIENNIYSISIPVPSHRFSVKQKEFEKQMILALEKVKIIIDKK